MKLVELIPEVTGHRVSVEQIEVYYRNGFAFNKLDRSKWIGTKDAQGRITIKFVPLLRTRELKIHCNYDDLDIFQLPVDRAEFMNSPEKLVTVYQKFASRTESYEYDAMGNRTAERILLRKEYGYIYTYYPNSNRLQSKIKQDGSERYDYEYDANGNMTVKIVTKGEKTDRWEYAYDLLNQLEQVKKNGDVVSSYIYDPNGFRVEKVGSKGKIHYVPLLNGEVGYRKEFSTNAEYSFVYVGIQHLARVNGVIGGSGKKFYYHNDHLGSALAVTDEYGNKVVERDFTPFGERINTDVYDDEPRDVDEDESGFTGKDWDVDAELYYYNARWYDPEVGRFISEDSVADDPTLYVYCYGNPVNFIDPTGYFSLSALGTMANFIRAAATLSGDENLGVIANAFDVFIVVGSLFAPVQKMEQITDLANKGEELDTSVLYGDKLPEANIDNVIKEIQKNNDLFKETDESRLKNAIEKTKKTKEKINNEITFNSTTVDSFGKVISVEDDGDLGVYVINDDGTKKKIGETLFWDTFAKKDRNGNPVKDKNGKVIPEGVIHIGVDKTKIIRNLAIDAKGKNPYDVAMGSRDGGKYDVSSQWGYDPADGFLLCGKYMTVRDMGNVLAGVNAANLGITYDTFQRMAGALHQGGGKLDIIQAFWGKEYGPPPTYGEVNLQYRMSMLGYYYYSFLLK